MLRSVALGSLLAATAAAAADPCECLNWKQVYETKGVACGEGQELMQEKMGYKDAFWAPEFLPEVKQVCHNFKAMDNNICFNWNTPSQYGTDRWDSQWCYVDSKCTELNGGRKVPDSETMVEWVPYPLFWLLGKSYSAKLYDFISANFHTPQPLKRDVSVKICSGSDRRSRDIDPDDYMMLGKAAGVHLEIFTKQAYNTVRGLGAHPLWQDVRNQIGKGGNVKKLPKSVQEAMQKKVPIVVDTDGDGRHDKSQRIIKGSKVYKLNARCPFNSCLTATTLSYSTPRGHDVGEL